MGAEPLSRRSRQGELLGGKYLLEERLGSGGMGDVWRARHVALEREVAIKVLRSEHADNRDIAARFLKEARTANLVRHPNVVDVLDVGQDDEGAPFLVQELLVGQDLGRYATDKGGSLPVDEALRILLPVIDAVAFAHAKGVVHRDLKPENVFLAREGSKLVPKLLDFGISQVASAPRMTASGVALGTPAYMAPEQIKGTRLVDARTDVWALGVMLHEVLSGALPFAGETSADMFVQIATEKPIPLEQAVPGIPRGLARVVAKCLRRAPDERFADARAMLQELRSIASGGEIEMISLPSEAPPPAAASQPSARELAPTQAARPPAHSPGPIVPPPGPDSKGGGRLISLAPPIASLPLQLASTPPPSRFARIRASLRPARDNYDARRPLTAVAFAVAALVLGGALTKVNPWPEGWGLGPLTASLFGSLPDPVARGVALGFLALGGLVGVRGWRLTPRSASYFIAAAGTVALGGVLLVMGPAASQEAAWAAALVAVGAAAVALRHATDDWLAELRSSAVVLLIAATGALFAAAQLVRGQP